MAFADWSEFQAAIEEARLIFEALPDDQKPNRFWLSPNGVSFEREGGKFWAWGNWFPCVPDNLTMPRLFG